MSVRIVPSEKIQLDEYTTVEAVTVYATTREEAMSVATDGFVIGSTLILIGEGGMYMLDADGSRGGVWRSVRDGAPLTDGGEG
jgi:hypothetical protein